MTIDISRDVLAGVPVLIARTHDLAMPASPVIWYPGYRASAAANEGELVRIAEAGFVAVGVDAVGHGLRADGDPDDRIPGNPRGALGVMLELAAATVAELPALLGALASAGLATRAPAAVVGVSMGGYIAYRAPLVEPGVRTVVALLGSPDWPDEPERAHLHASRMADVALLSVTAECDASVPPDAARRLHASLPPEHAAYVELTGEGHLVSAAGWRRLMDATVDWLRRYHAAAGDVQEARP